VDYDEGEVNTLEILGVPMNMAGFGWEGGESELSANDDDEDRLMEMKVECQDDVCIPKYNAI